MAGSVRLSQHSTTWGGFEEGRFWFSDAASVAAGNGAMVRSSGTPKSSFATTEVGIFAQYVFDLAPGLRATLGGRYDYEVLPASEVTRSLDWFAASGVPNDTYPTKLTQIGGLGSLSWDVTGDGRTIVEGTMSVENGDMDPLVLHEGFVHDGAARIARYVGSSVPWPASSVPASATTAPTLTIFGPDSRAPRTTRASFGLTHHASGGLNLYLGATNRRTDFLRASPQPQPGRPSRSRWTATGGTSSASWSSVGSMIAVEPGSNRRFSDFDDVWAIDTDGWSEYRACTVGVEYRGAPRSTSSPRTPAPRRATTGSGRPPARPNAQRRSGLSTRDGWVEGTSDFDVPDRLVRRPDLGLGPDRVVSATAVARYESGLPFTPGYRAGVDVNGDGSATTTWPGSPTRARSPASPGTGPA